jgi:hypothetical protein
MYGMLNLPRVPEAGGVLNDAERCFAMRRSLTWYRQTWQGARLDVRAARVDWLPALAYDCRLIPAPETSDEAMLALVRHLLPRLRIAEGAWEYVGRRRGWREAARILGAEVGVDELQRAGVVLRVNSRRSHAFDVLLEAAADSRCVLAGAGLQSCDGCADEG